MKYSISLFSRQLCADIIIANAAMTVFVNAEKLMQMCSLEEEKSPSRG